MVKKIEKKRIRVVLGLLLLPIFFHIYYEWLKEDFLLLIDNVLRITKTGFFI